MRTIWEGNFFMLARHSRPRDQAMRRLRERAVRERPAPKTADANTAAVRPGDPNPSNANVALLKVNARENRASVQ